jgi:hypothetical protein
MIKWIALAFLSLTLAGFGLISVSALPVSQIQGSNWKSECKSEGGNLRSCCQGKESSCQAGCQSGSSCGPACTQCKNECAASYNVCVAKKVSRPAAVTPSGQAPVRTQRN